MLRWLLRHCEQPQTLVAFDRIINRFNLVHKAVTKKSIFVMFFFLQALASLSILSFPSLSFLFPFPRREVVPQIQLKRSGEALLPPPGDDICSQ